MYRDLITILTVSALTAAYACAQYIPDSIGKDYAKAMIARFNADDTELKAADKAAKQPAKTATA